MLCPIGQSNEKPPLQALAKWGEYVTAYKNLIISAELLFRDYADLMEELDIRDGYELFYVLKSSICHWKGPFEISFRRVPTIIIGNGSEAMSLS